MTKASLRKKEESEVDKATTERDATADLRGHVDYLGADEASGWVCDILHPDRTLTVETLVDGVVVASVKANTFRPDLLELGLSNGYSGFRLKFPEHCRRDNSHELVLRVAETGAILWASHSHPASTKKLGQTSGETSSPPTEKGNPDAVVVSTVASIASAFPHPRYHAHIDGAFGDTVHGWVFDRERADRPVQIMVTVNGAPAGFATAGIFRTDLAEAGIGTGMHGFEFKLPAWAAADGEQLIELKTAESDRTIAAALLTLMDLTPSATPAITIEKRDIHSLDAVNEFLLAASGLAAQGSGRESWKISSAARACLNDDHELAISLLEKYYLSTKYLSFFSHAVGYLIHRRTSDPRRCGRSAVGECLLLPAHDRIAQVAVVPEEDDASPGECLAGIYSLGKFEPFIKKEVKLPNENVVVQISLAENSISSYVGKNAFWCRGAQHKVLNNYTSFGRPKSECGKVLLDGLVKRKDHDIPFEPDVEVIIPVYGAPDLYERFFRALGRGIRGIRKVLIADDGSDNHCRSLLSRHVKDLAQHVNVELFMHDQNIGFVRNVNFLFKKVTASYAALLTTDVVVPVDWAPRLAAPLRHGAALATPLATNGENLSVNVPEGANFRDVDLTLQLRSPLYPGACTAIGYCLGINCGILPKNEPLFDEEIENGYADDSDLHFRCVVSGYRSVIVDNLFVHHEGAKSFSQIPNKKEILKKNRDLFFNRWGHIYKQDIENIMRLHL